MNKKPIIAFLYDFDKTLCTTDMQDYTFIPSLGYTPGEFWSIANSFGFENRMDGLLAYMYTMIEECRKKGIRLDRDYLVSCGHAIELFPGVQDWFSRINAFGETLGVEIEHYVLSSGLREIIEGSGVSHEFKEIYACEFFYNEEGLASWPKLDVNFTNKTQFVYRINKGILDVAKDKELNASMPDDSKRIPRKQNGGTGVFVHDARRLFLGFGFVLERVAQSDAQNGLGLYRITLGAVVVELEIDARGEVFRRLDVERVLPADGGVDRQRRFGLLILPVGLPLVVGGDVVGEFRNLVFLAEVRDPAVEREEGRAVAQHVAVAEFAVEIDLDRRTAFLHVLIYQDLYK